MGSIKGDKRVFALLGASNHTEAKRQNEDYYATDPKAIDYLLDLCKETDLELSKNIWENACGEGHLSNRLKEYGFNVKESDLVDRGINAEIMDFMEYSGTFDGDIITNPPFMHGGKWVKKCLDTVKTGNHVILLLRTLFLEGQTRGEFFKKYPPKYVFVFSFRLVCAKNGDFETYTGSAQAYSWFVWEKGYTGDTIIKWIRRKNEK